MFVRLISNLCTLLNIFFFLTTLYSIFVETSMLLFLQLCLYFLNLTGRIGHSFSLFVSVESVAVL